ncbi:MAG: DMT family transporter [Deinococcota bacterium]|nr:DMT family transporter [Deinococcota bacterium]
MDAEPGRGRLFLILGVGLVAVSLAAIFIRLAEAPGVVVAAYRMLLASLVLLPWTLRALRRTPLNRGNLPYALGAGFFLGAHFATWISSLSYTTVAASVALVTTNPLWVALLSWLFLSSPPTARVLLGALVAVAGAVMIGVGDLQGGSEPLLGNGLAVLGAISVSCYILLGRSAQRRGLGLQAYVGVAYGAAALMLLPLPLILGFSYLDYSLKTFFWTLLLALVPQLIGHTSLNYAVKYLAPTVVATIFLLEPIGSAALALLLFREVPTALTAAGAVVLLLGVGLASYGRRPRRVRRGPSD